MNKGIWGIIVAASFVAGTISVNPVAEAANPLLEEIQATIGLIKTETDKIDDIKSETDKIQMVQDDIAALETGVSAETETQIDDIESNTEQIINDIAALETGVSAETEAQIDNIETQANKIQIVKDQIPILQHVRVDITVNPADGENEVFFPASGNPDGFLMGRYNLRASGISGDNAVEVRCNIGPLFNHLHATVPDIEPTTENDFTCRFIQLIIRDGPIAGSNGIDDPEIHVEGTITYFKSTDQIDFTHP